MCDANSKLFDVPSMWCWKETDRFPKRYSQLARTGWLSNPFNVAQKQSSHVYEVISIFDFSFVGVLVFSFILFSTLKQGFHLILCEPPACYIILPEKRLLSYMEGATQPPFKERRFPFFWVFFGRELKWSAADVAAIKHSSLPRISTFHCISFSFASGWRPTGRCWRGITCFCWFCEPADFGSTNTRILWALAPFCTVGTLLFPSSMECRHML